MAKLYRLRTLSPAQYQAIITFLESQERLRMQLRVIFPAFFDEEEPEDLALYLQTEEGLDVFKQAVALAALVLLLTETDFGPYRITRQEFAENSLAVAIWAQQLSIMGEASTVDGFLSGLYYRIGIVPIARILSRINTGNVLAEGASFQDQSQWERNQVGKDFPSIGYDLLELWQIPEAVRSPVRGQLRPALCGQYKAAALRLNVARILSRSFFSPSITSPLADVPPASLASLGLTVPNIILHMQAALDRFHRLRAPMLELVEKRSGAEVS
ncbi:MAG: HDOD domain-containing protein [Verrucomicrobiota bacterium JB022]|nr:HDOD domain-containing protein [Verrucomicrobiota bacterium JB022]